MESGVRKGCKLAVDLFLLSTDQMIEQTVTNTHTGLEIFSKLDFADNVALTNEIWMLWSCRSKL